MCLAASLLCSRTNQPTNQPVADNGKVFTAATLLTLFTVLEAKSSATYCAPHEHVLAALFIWYALHAPCSPLFPELLFWIHRQTAQRLLGPVRRVPDSGGSAWHWPLQRKS